MKVLVITNDLSCTHGWSTYSHNVITGLRKNGAEPIALVKSPTPNETSEVNECLPYGPEKLMWNPYVIWQTARTLKKVIEQERPNIIHFAIEPYHMALCFLRPTVPVVLTIHGSYAVLPVSVRGIKKKIGQFIFRQAHRRVDHVIAVSEHTKQRYLSRVPVPRPATVITNAFEKKCGCVNEPKKMKEVVRAITVGMVKPRKGILESIELLSEWSQLRKQKTVYDVVGKIEEQSTYTAMVRQAAAKSQHKYFDVILHGRVSEEKKCELMRKATFYTHLEPGSASDVEGYGIGIIEAAAHGLPALVTKIGATQEAVIHSKTGYVVDLADKEKVFKVLDMLSVSSNIDQIDLQSWVNDHDVRLIAKKIIDLYKHIIASNAH